MILSISANPLSPALCGKAIGRSDSFYSRKVNTARFSCLSGNWVTGINLHQLFMTVNIVMEINRTGSVRERTLWRTICKFRDWYRKKCHFLCFFHQMCVVLGCRDHHRLQIIHRDKLFSRIDMFRIIHADYPLGRITHGVFFFVIYSPKNRECYWDKNHMHIYKEGKIFIIGN